MPSSEMLHRVAFERTDVSQESIAFIIKVTIIGELGTTSAVTSNRSTLQFRGSHCLLYRMRASRGNKTQTRHSSMNYKWEVAHIHPQMNESSLRRSKFQLPRAMYILTSYVSLGLRLYEAWRSSNRHKPRRD
jgi:hypothetical protein